MKGYAAIEEQMMRINLRRCVDSTPLLLAALQSFDHSGGNAAAFQMTHDSEGSMTDIATCTFPNTSSLDSIMDASKKDDPFDAIRAAEPPPPPVMPTDGARASAILSTFFAGGASGAVDDAVNRIMMKDGGANLLICDLINYSTVLTAMLSQLLGSSPHAVAARLSTNSKDA